MIHGVVIGWLASAGFVWFAVELAGNFQGPALVGLSFATAYCLLFGFAGAMIYRAVRD